MLASAILGDKRDNADLFTKVAFYVSALGTGIFLLRVLGQPWPNLKAVYPDSFSYLDVAARGPIRLFDERPTVYPTFLWLMGRNVRLALVAQTLAYAGSFFALAVTAVRAFSSRLAAGALIFLTLGIALAPRFALWNAQVLTESLGIALAIASISAWWSFSVRPRPSAATWAWIWTLLWLGIRDSHLLPMLLVILPTVILTALLWRGMEAAIRKRLLAGAVLAVVLSAQIYVAQDVSHRTQYPVHNNVGLRILPDPDLTRWFVAGGMPLDDALRARKGRVSWDDNEAFLKAPELEPYRQWAAGPGRVRFLSSMLLLFPAWYQRLSADLPNLLSGSLVEYDSYKVRERLPSNVSKPLGLLHTRAGFLGWTGLAVGGLILGVGAVVRVKAPLAVVIFGAAGLLSAFVELYGSYVGDALEVGRHLVGPFLRLVVMMAICVAIGIDAALRLRRGSPADVTEAIPVEDSLRAHDS